MAKDRIDDETRALVAERLNYSIDRLQITARELSKRTGISEVDISNYRHGRYIPRQDKIFLLAMALGVDPAWLWGFDVEEHSPNERDYLWNCMNAEMQEQALDYMRYLILKKVKADEET